MYPNIPFTHNYCFVSSLSVLISLTSCLCLIALVKSVLYSMLNKTGESKNLYLTAYLKEKGFNFHP